MRDLRTFFEEYSKLLPEEIITVDKPVDCKWFASAIASKVEMAYQTVPVLIFNKRSFPMGRFLPIQVL